MQTDHSGNSQQILIVDDTGTSRLKLKLAVEALGYPAVAVSSGADALKALETEAFDLILLDIVMPEMDGFEVLEKLKANSSTTTIPVLIISSLEEEATQVARGIKLGAVDFLPKQVNPAILGARISTSLERKKLHDAEQQYRDHVNQLSAAAEVLEQGVYNPTHLNLNNVQVRTDALGNFGRVFTSLAEDIYRRERRLNRQVNTLKGMLLLVATGTVIGISVPLSKMGAEQSPHVFGMTAWVLLFAAVFGIGISLVRGTLPRLSRFNFRFLVFWGLLTASSQVLLFWIAGHMQASMLAIILVTEGFIVFAFAAIMKLEEPRFKRLAGLCIGFMGVLLIVLAGDQLDMDNGWIWVGLALSIPMVFAIEDIFIAARLPEEWDVVGAVGLVSLVALVLILPVVLLSGDGVRLSLVPGKLEWVVLLLALETLAGTVLMVLLLKVSGAVFGSQVGYVMTFAGIGWSFILLNETLPLMAWVALGIIFIGLLLVEPKEEAEPIPDLPEPPETIQARNPTASVPHR